MSHILTHTLSHIKIKNSSFEATLTCCPVGVLTLNQRALVGTVCIPHSILQTAFPAAAQCSVNLGFPL